VVEVLKEAERRRPGTVHRLVCDMLGLPSGPFGCLACDGRVAQNRDTSWPDYCGSCWRARRHRYTPVCAKGLRQSSAGLARADWLESLFARRRLARRRMAV